jgi:hypothetical protein
MTLSLGGFVAQPDDGIGELFESGPSDPIGRTRSKTASKERLGSCR